MLDETLPTGRCCPSAVWDGTHAYIFGGGAKEIVRFTPSTNTVTTLTAALPTDRDWTSAVWDGTHAYIFGGDRGGSPLKEIVRFTPSTNTVTTLTATLPTARWDTSAVWDGTHAYIFGGLYSWHAGALSEIVRFTPSTNAVTTLAATLPSGRAQTSAVWDGAHAYIFGGRDDSYLNQIVRFTPSTNAVTTLTNTLGITRDTSAVWDGTHAYIFYGQIKRFTPSTNTVTLLSSTLPSGSGASAVWDGAHAYTFGGGKEIVRFTVTIPPSPQNLAATSGPGVGEIRLTWQAPRDDGGAPVTGYRLYRGQASGTETFLTQLGDVLTFTDSGLPNGAWRYYKVTALNDVGEGNASDGASARTFDLPSPPRNLMAKSGPGVGQIQLTWQAPSYDGGAPITDYRVYRSAPGQPFTPVATTGVTSAFTDAGLTKCVHYTYRVTAINAVGEGLSSAEARMRAPCEPSAPRTSVATSGDDVGEVTLRWQVPEDDGGIPIRHYRVLRSTLHDAPDDHSIVLTVTSTSFLDVDLLPGVRYWYRVVAINEVGAGPLSNEATARASLLTSGLDADGDLIPGLVERQLCGTPLVRFALGLGEGRLGSCGTGNPDTDYQANPLLPDADDDLIPDGHVEWLLCLLIDTNDPIRGVCADRDGDGYGDDYGLPPYSTTELQEVIL